MTGTPDLITLMTLLLYHTIAFLRRQITDAFLWWRIFTLIESPLSPYQGRHIEEGLFFYPERLSVERRERRLFRFKSNGRLSFTLLLM